MTGTVITLSGKSQSSMDSPDDDEPASGNQAVFMFENALHRDTALSRLNKLRKAGKFCDIILEVGAHEVPAHRAVLASASPYLFDLFEECDNLLHLKLGKLDYKSFDVLLNYAYTSRLEVAVDQVCDVYKVAMDLKMEHASEALSQHLAENLQINNCIGIRKIANYHTDKDKTLAERADEFMHNNLDAVLESPEMKDLPRVQVDLVGAERMDLAANGNASHTSKLIIDWLKNASEIDSLEHFTQNVSMLYLTSDNVLKDAKDVVDFSLNKAEVIQDYKKKFKHRQMSNGKHKERVQGSPPTPDNAVRKISIDRPSMVEREWNLIAAKANSGKSLTCLSMLGSVLCMVSVTSRYMPSPTPDSNGVNGASSDSETPSPASPQETSTRNVIPLAPMSSARCSVGTAVLDGKVVALGGYDRGECLKTVEAYNPGTNEWEAFEPMLSPRGRFDVSQLEGKLFACGGSNGFEELNTAECYDPEKKLWIMLPNMIARRSSSGVAVVGGKLYVVGGWSGASGLSDCEVFDARADKWICIANLNVGRTQCAVCAMSDTQLMAMGGTDSWNCLNSVEIYDTQLDKWTMMPPMTTGRRGAGVALFKGKVYVVGGSDGTSSLASVEVFDLQTQTWTLGPALGVPRANVGVAVLNSTLYAVGGFSGKVFLDTIEYLTQDAQEWSSHMPQDSAIC